MNGTITIVIVPDESMYLFVIELGNGNRESNHRSFLLRLWQVEQKADRDCGAVRWRKPARAGSAILPIWRRCLAI